MPLKQPIPSNHKPARTWLLVAGIVVFALVMAWLVRDVDSPPEGTSSSPAPTQVESGAQSTTTSASPLPSQPKPPQGIDALDDTAGAGTPWPTWPDTVEDSVHAQLSGTVVSRSSGEGIAAGGSVSGSVNTTHHVG